MSDFIGVARKEGISTGTALRTVLQLLAPANHRLRLLEAGISFHGIVNTNEPITVDLIRQTTAGSGGTGLTPVKLDDSLSETLQTTALHTITTEPTAGDVLMTWAVHPQTGLIYQVPQGQEIKIGGGDRLGLRVLAGASVNCDAYLKFEE